MKRIMGLMSGTSVDGVDAVVVDLRGHGLSTKFKMLAFETVPFRPSTRQLILSSLNAKSISVAEISQLNFLIGELFAEAALKVCEKNKIPIRSVDLIGSHGQTIYHQSIASTLEGRRVASTLQLGEGAVIAERTGVTTISNFRVRDVAAGGAGAPLVPYVDFVLLRNAKKNRVALNIGGIANVTWIPRGCRFEELLAFDTGPGNMIMDAAIAHRTDGRLSFDLDGGMAARGLVIPSLLNGMLEHPFYKQKPPKAAGHEQFGIEYTTVILRKTRSVSTEDLLASLAELTARSIVEGLERFAARGKMIDELIVSGGGARNRFLMSRLQAHLPKTKVLTSTEVGIDLDAKEAIAFAILANETWHYRPSNVPSVTGAKHPVILGNITPATPLRRASNR